MSVCTHESATGIDKAEGPDKVWRCDHCGWLHRHETDTEGTTRAVAVVELGADRWRTNGDLIASVHSIGRQAGWWPDGARVLDATYGRGKWWTRYRPPAGRFTRADLLTGDDVDVLRVDFRATPWAGGTFDVIAFDPPYVGVGGVTTSTLGDFHDRYGVGEASKGHAAVLDLITAGITEQARILATGGVLLVKAMNYVVGGHYRPVAYDAAEHARGLGLQLVDEWVHVRGAGPQPARESQHHARRNYSHLFAFQRPARAGVGAGLCLAHDDVHHAGARVGAFRCTLDRGHDGPHVAHDERRAPLHTWGELHLLGP